MIGDDVPGVPPVVEGYEWPDAVSIREVHQEMTGRSNPSQKKKPAQAEWRTTFRFRPAPRDIYGPCQQEGEKAGSKNRMGEAAVVLEIGGGSPEAGDDVQVRQVRGGDQGEGGKPRLAVQSGLAQSDSRQSVGQVIHSSFSKLETAAAILYVLMPRVCVLKSSNFREPTPSSVALRHDFKCRG